MIFYNKILHSNNIVLRILCALHRNEAQKLSSIHNYHIVPGHSSIDVMFCCCLFCSFLFLYVFIVYLSFVFFLLLCCLIRRNKE